MKFRNFDKIGLTTEKQVRKFLGDIWFEHLKREEISLCIILERDWNVKEINPDIVLENIVCLINEKDKYERPLLCIVEPSLKRGEDDKIATCYCLQATNRLMVTDFKATFDTQDEAYKMANSLYGLSSSDEISAKLRGEDENE